MGIHAIQGVLSGICARAGLSGKCTNHALKATAATRLYEKGVDEQLIQELWEIHQKQWGLTKRTGTRLNLHLCCCLKSPFVLTFVVVTGLSATRAEFVPFFLYQSLSKPGTSEPRMEILAPTNNANLENFNFIRSGSEWIRAWRRFCICCCRTALPWLQAVWVHAHHTPGGRHVETGSDITPRETCDNQKHSAPALQRNGSSAWWIFLQQQIWHEVYEKAKHAGTLVKPLPQETQQAVWVWVCELCCSVCRKVGPAPFTSAWLYTLVCDSRDHHSWYGNDK